MRHSTECRHDRLLSQRMPMLASVDSPKAEPGDVARAALDGV
jgi:hypothetical protein